MNMAQKSVVKGLVLAAVSTACGYAAAATITVTNTGTGVRAWGSPQNQNLSIEGAAATPSSASALTGLKVVLSMGAFHSRDSIVQLQLTNARFASIGAFSAPSVTCFSDNIVLDVGAPTAASATWDFGITGTSGTTSNAVCTFSSLALQASSLTTAGNITIAAGTKRTSDSTYSYDATTASAVIATAQSQIGAITVGTAFNGIVDYQSKQGYGFVTNDGGSSSSGDILTVRVATNDTQLSLTTALSLNFVVSAESGKSFSFLDNEACGTTPVLNNRSTTTGRAYATITGGSTTLTINATCSTLTFVGTAPMTLGNTVTASVELGHKDATPSTGIVIEPMTFPSFTATVSQAGTTRGTPTSIVPGSWTSNGATVVIPYMPINLTAGTSAIDPVITIANRSSLTGVLTGTMRDEDGNACVLDNLGSVGATRTKNLGGLVKAAFAACANLSQTSTERMYISITATLPDSTTTFYSGYTVGNSSRVSVVNSSNGK